MDRLVLGLEIHLQPTTAQKMFCGCSAAIWQAKPNSHTCPTCLGLPGALPVPNFEAVKKTQLLGLALGCTVSKLSRFDRKHYYYPDLPKGYQISQYKQPLCLGGNMTLSSGKVSEIERIHLEEDTAKSFHERDNTLVDFNKSGMPLIEIVTRPIFTSIKEAAEFGKKIQHLVRWLGISDADMEKGQMRLEANISLRTPEMEEAGELPDYKVEIKNINSFKFFEKAVESEIRRQTQLYAKGQKPIQENRGFIEATGETVSQRSKEEAKDYRYFPEPDIPSMEFTDDYIANLSGLLPELPEETISRLVNKYSLNGELAKVLVENFGDKVATLDSYVNRGLAAEKVAKAIVNKKDLATLEKSSDDDVASLSEEDLREMLTKVLENNPRVLADYKKGKENALNVLVGIALKEAKGSITAHNVREKLLVMLHEL